MNLDTVVGAVGVVALILTLAAGRLGLASERYRLATTSERLALHYDRAGDAELAAKYYAEFVRLAAGQDDAVAARVEAARERLDDLSEERTRDPSARFKEAS